MAATMQQYVDNFNMKGYHKILIFPYCVLLSKMQSKVLLWKLCLLYQRAKENNVPLLCFYFKFQQWKLSFDFSHIRIIVSYIKLAFSFLRTLPFDELVIRCAEDIHQDFFFDEVIFFETYTFVTFSGQLVGILS